MPYLTACYEVAELSLLDSDSSNLLSVGLMRESGSQVCYALEAPDETQMSITDH